MNEVKKSISILLSLIMVLSLFTAVPFTAGAATTDNVSTEASSGNYEYKVLTDGTAEITNYYDKTTECTPDEGFIGNVELEIPSELDGYTVTGIVYQAFGSCESLKSVTIPDSVTSIGGSAFMGCNSLKSVTIPDSVTSIGEWTFKDCTSLTNIAIDTNNEYYTSLDGNLYNKDQTGLIQYAVGKSDTDFTIPDGVTSIGDLAFYDCRSLTSVTIPDSVTSIGDEAFNNCTNLTSVTIPDSVTSIGHMAFNDCTSLTSVTIPDSVTSIGGWAFGYCTSLTNITIPDSVTSMGNRAFYNTGYYNDSSNWENGVLYIDNFLITADSDTVSGEYIIKDGTKAIADGAFSYCSNLTSITIPDSVTSIGDFAFSGCENLTGVTISGSVTSIGEEAFSYCTSLTSVTIPDSVTNIGRSAFGSCTSLTNIAVDTNSEYYSSLDGNLYNKDQTELIQYAFGKSDTDFIIPDTVTSIGDGAFENYTNLTSVTIPDTVTSIGDSAFCYCTSLTSVTIPDGVTSIGEDAFYSCESLTSVNIPDSVTSIGDSAFSYCTGLTSITIPYGVTCISDRVFEVCTSLTSVTIPDSVTSIGKSAFSSCLSLTSVTIPDSVTSIGGSAFWSCKSLTSVTIGGSVTSIGRSAFRICENLTSITIPDSVTSIGEYAFSNCESLASINVESNNDNYCSADGVLFNKNKTKLILYPNCKTESTYEIPDSVTSIGEGAFSSCTNLTSITVPDSVTYIGEYAFTGCENLTNITIPDSITSIGYWAFNYCTNLTSITIPDSVTRIGESTFYNCISLTGITIPDSVKCIGRSAFGNCTSLTSITIPDSVIGICQQAFYDCRKLAWISIGNGVKYIGDYTFYGCENLSHVFYRGNESEWDSVGQSFPDNVIIHYNSNSSMVSEKTVLPSCTEDGYDLYSCSECGQEFKANYTKALGHNIINGTCERCGKDELDCIESLHPYEDNTDESWTIHKDNAKRIDVIFSEVTETESEYDYIYIYNKDNEEIGCYSGTELSGKRIIVHGDTATIRLTSDGSNTCYGFSITDIKPYYEECKHLETELINVREAGCNREGYTGDVRCVECQDILSYGKYIDATGIHEFENGICKFCGRPDVDSLEHFKANDTKNVEITTGGEYKYFKFTPDKNGTLNFYSTGSCDTYGYLYDENMNELTYNDDYNDSNFCISYDLEEGKTYIVACRMYSSDETGTFNVTLEFDGNSQILTGDVDLDGVVSITDATLIQMHLAQLKQLNDEQLAAADADGNGMINIIDVTMIQRYLAMLIPSLG